LLIWLDCKRNRDEWGTRPLYDHDTITFVSLRSRVFDGFFRCVAANPPPLRVIAEAEGAINVGVTTLPAP